MDGKLLQPGGSETGLDRLASLVDHRGDDRMVPWLEYLAVKEKEKTQSVFLSGFTELDFYTQGFKSGELVTISGFTGMGKTLFLKSLIRSFCLENSAIATLSYEDPIENYLDKYREDGKNYKIYVPMSLKTGDLSWLEDRILESKLKYDTKIVTIDHLHYLLDLAHGKENLSLKVGSVMRFLKSEIAIKMGLVVFIVAHQEKVRDTKEEASINTIRDSSFIGQESDTVIIVQRMPDQNDRENFSEGLTMVKIDKARRTGTFRKRLTFKKDSHWLKPL